MHNLQTDVASPLPDCILHTFHVTVHVAGVMFLISSWWQPLTTPQGFMRFSRLGWLRSNSCLFSCLCLLPTGSGSVSGELAGGDMGGILNWFIREYWGMAWMTLWPAALLKESQEEVYEDVREEWGEFREASGTEYTGASPVFLLSPSFILPLLFTLSGAMIQV